MRVIFEQLRCRFVGVRLHDCIEHDIVPDTAAALSSDAPRLPDSGTLVDEYVGLCIQFPQSSRIFSSAAFRFFGSVFFQSSMTEPGAR